ncbi:anti-repressor SinI family protein [Alkalihalobacillus sp. AL-G]|nr:anti-repressor SinI family protein [Alkalihalobacillus sp. AL-G]WLD91516.1 anti-repressor SinI family protein [Alkalihalobacillus sp. AL-G]
MEKQFKQVKLDHEWVELMKVAKQAGMTKTEVRAFFQQKFSLKAIQPKV